MNNTTDPNLRSFIATAADSDFPIQNLPYCSFRRAGAEQPNLGVRIGDFVLDLKALEHRGLFRDTALGETHVFCKRSINKLASLGRPAWTAARERISHLLRHDTPTLRDDNTLRDEALLPIESVTLELPAEIGDYTDFYSSREHATNVGIMFRGRENALMENWLWLPVGYHGRASSIVLSGTDVTRPRGQTKKDGDPAPTFGPSKSLDFELEMGFFIGPGNKLGQPITLRNAADHIFGMVIVNDWSARDIQRWEYQPLGPFLAKNFATSISAYVVTMDALAPFRCQGPKQDPPPLEYLGGADSAGETFDIHLEVALRTAKMTADHTICRSNFKYLYWSMAQQLAHHTITGCNLKPGDLLASGTISGPTPDSFGSMLELAWRGEKPLTMPNGEARSFLQDGDRLTMRAFCRSGSHRIGFGECTGRVVPSVG